MSIELTSTTVVKVTTPQDLNEVFEVWTANPTARISCRNNVTPNQPYKFLVQFIVGSLLTGEEEW